MKMTISHKLRRVGQKMTPSDGGLESYTGPNACREWFPVIVRENFLKTLMY
ncbi:hypothetical protein [Methylophaga sp. SB9B]|uniref:hypothetical protein n=1 Tax=Methylophaga sp. SB9B TaxID=2570356 RepID=UPI0014562CB7|nr:hypothetical protein [Methylophaga sp. SB9B]